MPVTWREPQGDRGPLRLNVLVDEPAGSVSESRSLSKRLIGGRGGGRQGRGAQDSKPVS